ncbi:hypothetical protein PMAYCL1PPCAC_22766, partial [Pristionchus mayeri]
FSAADSRSVSKIDDSSSDFLIIDERFRIGVDYNLFKTRKGDKKKRDPGIENIAKRFGDYLTIVEMKDVKNDNEYDRKDWYY